MNGTTSGNMLFAFAVGSVVGAVAALMLAPAAGSETRRRLREASAKTADRARGALDRARRAAADQAHRIGHALDECGADHARNVGRHESRWDDEAREGVVTHEPGAA